MLFLEDPKSLCTQELINSRKRLKNAIKFSTMHIEINECNLRTKCTFKKEGLQFTFENISRTRVLYVLWQAVLLRVYQEGGDRVFLPVLRHIAMISGLERRLLSKMVPIYCVNVLDPNMPFSERKSSPLKR